MNKRHKHADVIIAWANGEEIEFRHSVSNEWEPVSPPTRLWKEEYEYRIKPEPKSDIRARLWVDTVNKIHLTFVFDGETKKFKDCEFHQD